MYVQVNYCNFGYVDGYGPVISQEEERKVKDELIREVAGFELFERLFRVSLSLSVCLSVSLSLLSVKCSFHYPKVSHSQKEVDPTNL